MACPVSLPTARLLRTPFAALGTPVTTLCSLAVVAVALGCVDRAWALPVVHGLLAVLCAAVASTRPLGERRLWRALAALYLAFAGLSTFAV